MATPDMDVIKKVPGYRVILKAVLKSQIQQLIEQLASATNEESIILTASVADGTLSHLGSDSAKGFLEDHEDLKSKFLGHCMSMYQKQQDEDRREKEHKDQEEEMLKLQLATAGQYRQAVHSYSSQFVSPRKSGLVHPVSLTRNSPRIRHEPYSRPSTGRVTPNKTTEMACVKTEPADDSGSEIATFTNNSFTNNSPSSHPSNLAVTNDDENVNCSLSVKPEHFSDESESRVMCGDESELSDDTSVNVKQEATSDSEINLKILGVETGQPVQPPDWVADVSMAMNFDPTGATGSQADMTGESSNNTVPDVSSSSKKPNNKERSSGFNSAWKSEFPWVREVENDKYGCSVYGKTFRSKAHLTMHARVHTGERPFTCAICDKGFTQKGNMRAHMISHIDVSMNLYEHARVHTGERPFTCAICDKGFTQKGNMRAHMISHIDVSMNL